ncbi:MAG: hypothetical protein LJE60_07040 [Thiocapsa sp.]|jgi:phosphoserine phosphatase|nr:hypothetical protein [Thiocapsa sp.]MCG6896846.1 hypothetical protein [Thiocapsa sp.]
MTRERQPADDQGESLRDWHLLDAAEQAALLIEHGRYLDSLPPTCDLDSKVERLRRWLRERGIRYPS